jgi:diguanylate cyclase (GGDEF)-like protein/PAS domain S-box-containing protein
MSVLRFRLRTRIFLSFGVLIALLLGIAGLGTYGLSVVVQEIDIMDGITGNANRLQELVLRVETIRRGLAEYHIDGNANTLAEIIDSEARAATLLQQAEDYTLSEQRRSVFNKISSRLQSFVSKQEQFVSLRGSAALERGALFAAAGTLPAALIQLPDTAGGVGPADAAAMTDLRLALQTTTTGSTRFFDPGDPSSTAMFKTSAASAAQALVTLNQSASPDIRSAVPPVMSALARYTAAFDTASAAFVEAEARYSNQIRPDLLDLQQLIGSVLDKTIAGFNKSGTIVFAVSSETMVTQLSLSAVATVLGIILAFLVARSIVRPINGMTAAMTRLAAGDTRSEEVPGRHDTNEIGEMARALEVFRDNAIRIMVSEANMSAIIENMVEGIVMFSPDCRVVLLNQKFADATGMSRSGGNDLSVSDVMRSLIRSHGWPAKILREVQERLEAVREENGQQTFDIILPDGRSFTLMAAILPNHNLLLSAQDVTERRASAARIYHLAHHDVLTDLPNRALFQERLAAAVDNAIIEDGLGVSLLLCDLDRFKAVNDTYGHPVGDELLRQVAQRIRGNMRKTDILARLGGDEFAIICLSYTEQQEVNALAERIVEALREPFDINGDMVRVGVSIGLANAPADATCSAELMTRADLALYAAKYGGRNMFTVYDASMAEKLEERRALEVEIRRALDAGGFTVHYQPQVDLRTRRIIGFEALARWNHPERGFIAPNAFIPVAEETGLILELGEWVLRKACADAATWGGDTTVAVNVAAQQFNEANFVAIVRRALHDSGLAPERLELEVTETAMLNDSEKMLAVLHGLRSIGIRLSMDDFGTGYSALNYLQKFPFDKLKIDRSFVRELGGKGESEAIVRAVVGLGANLGITIIAEGIETEAQAKILLGTACDEAQGYLFSHAIAVDDVRELLLKQGNLALV